MSTALLIIDVQNAIVGNEAPPERQAAIDRALNETVSRLQTLQAEAWAANIPVVVVQHDGGPGDRLERNTTGWALRREIAPVAGDVLVHKKSCDSFFETDLETQFAQRSISHVVIGGCMSQFCVDTTARRAVTLGYDVTLLSDGHTTADMGASPSSRSSPITMLFSMASMPAPTRSRCAEQQT